MLASAADVSEKEELIRQAYNADMHTETGPVKDKLRFDTLKSIFKAKFKIRGMLKLVIIIM